MAEYIEREALKQSIRLIPRTAHPELVHYSTVQKVISDTPTADVVEVVRCWKCKHCDPDNKQCDHPLGTTLPISKKENDFCSYGELKECEGK